jgi:tripartite motif-containing protein 9/67
LSATQKEVKLTETNDFQSDLSKILTDLSEKAKAANGSINLLRQLQDQISVNCEAFKTNVNVQVDMLIQAIEQRRTKLLDFVDQERDNKRRVLRDQIARCGGHLNKTTGLIQFCIELLKETDAVAYLQVTIIRLKIVVFRSGMESATEQPKLISFGTKA